MGLVRVDRRGEPVQLLLGEVLRPGPKDGLDAIEGSSREDLNMEVAATRRITVIPSIGGRRPLNDGMAIQRRRGGGPGRPSKGERHVMATRIPVADAEWIFELADSQGISASEYLAALISEHLKTAERHPESQEELPISRAS